MIDWWGENTLFRWGGTPVLAYNEEDTETAEPEEDNEPETEEE